VSAARSPLPFSYPRRWGDRALAAAGAVERLVRAALRRLGSGELLSAAAEHRRLAARFTPLGEAPADLAGGSPILYLAALPWHYRFQRPQQLARALARAGHPVLYVEGFQRTRLLPARAVVHEEPSLQALRLRIPGRPDPYREVLDEEAAAGLAAAILSGLAPGAPPRAVLVQLPFCATLGGELARRLAVPLVYDRIDLHVGFPGVPTAMEAVETALLRSADLVCASSGLLAQRPRELGARVAEIRNAVDLAAFGQIGEQDSGDRLRHEMLRIGYVGALGAWFDAPAVAAAARARPEWRFRLAGRVEDAAVEALSALSAVELWGEIPYRRVPSFLAELDVMVIPFRDLPLTRSVDPVKLYEGLAAGLPVVARRLPETERWGEPLVYLYAAPEELVPQVERAAREQTAELAAQRRRAVRGETWDHRAADLLAAVATIIPPVDGKDRTRS
jgi:glycosyltransferase involved in cell wall biosynthesis